MDSFMRKMFLSGPIGNPKTPMEKQRLYEREALAAKIQGQLLDEGWACYNPYGAIHYGPNFNKGSAMWIESGLAFLVDCQAICMLPGWQDSAGCCTEYLAAKGLCMAVYTWEGGELKLHEPGNAPPTDDILNGIRQLINEVAPTGFDEDGA